MEALAVHGRESQFAYGFQVFRRAIARIHFKAVARIRLRVFIHQPVTIDFSENARRGNARDASVALDDGELLIFRNARDLQISVHDAEDVRARGANGICDDMLTTTVFATKAPCLISPAMNTGMWE